MPLITNRPLQIDYFVPDIGATLQVYDTIRWYRSRFGEAQLEAMTALTAEPARLYGKSGRHDVAEKTLSLRVSGSVVDITFAPSAEPLTTAQVVTAINNATEAVVAFSESGTLRISTASTGGAESLEVLESDAAPYMGLTIGAQVLGKYADTDLDEQTVQYIFVDPHGDPSYFYAAQFRNYDSAVESVISAPWPGSRGTGLSKSLIVPCFIRLAGQDGSPLVRRLITIHNAVIPNKVIDGGDTWGILRQSIELVTDENGYAEARLARGATVDVNVVGTGFTRRLRVPQDAESVDLLDPALVVEDEFGIAEPQINWALRTS